MVLKSHIICLDVSSDQSQNCSENQQFWLENVQCLTTISSTAQQVLHICWTPYIHTIRSRIKLYAKHHATGKVSV